MNSTGPAQLLDQLAGHFPGHAMQRVRLPDGRYRYTYLSPGVAETFGMDVAAMLAADSVAHDWLPEPDRARFVAALERSAETLATLDEEVRVRRPDGSTRWVRSIGHPRRQADGSVVWDGVALDVTDRYEARAALETALELARQREEGRKGTVDHAAQRAAHAVEGESQHRQQDEQRADQPHGRGLVTPTAARSAGSCRALRRIRRSR
ncbi:PAS domain-containing protein [Leptolyngbya sp. 15MV]|nr:PAS domain-containing protein [Leptolyngbya sp. 15MV]